MGGLTCTERDINAFLFRERCQTAPKRKSPNAFAEHPSDIANSNVNPPPPQRIRELPYVVPAQVTCMHGGKMVSSTLST